MEVKVHKLAKVSFFIIPKTDLKKNSIFRVEEE